MSGPTIHACAVAVNGIGVLIKGKSGSGKTSLALGLVERGQSQFGNAAMVADDRVTLEHRIEGLYASSPKLLAGRVEIRGFGIARIDYLDEIQLGLLVELVPDEQIQRMPAPSTIAINECSLPHLTVPERHEELAVRIVIAWLQENIQM